ncbi:hypothetical protein [Demequina zhanjiangensis]|uniref:DUF4129 domain-containing protein n=1 Tax=Demequina zhanjiangensis TaxID=3051659 RepID=A0ABT8G3M0_9MICO|nr:hypothetical protein [Demequina sp. SYSU T00b26]MDN4473726.1 hypothetical protein [Demequina sp. SYSU T00b26]
MRRAVRIIVAGTVGTALVFGTAACDSLPDIDPSRLPSISLPTRTTDAPDPEPTETAEPAPVETVTEEAAPEETEQATPEPSASPEEAADEEPFVWWPWAIAALVLLVLLIIWARAASKRRAWDRRLATARAEMSWLEDSLVPQVLAKPSAAEAAALWQSAKPRVLAADQELHALHEAAPGDKRLASAMRAKDVLNALVDAVDADTSTEGATDADSLRARRAALDKARADVRSYLRGEPA